MAHVVQFVPAIASVVALLIVSPRQAYRSAISALTDYATHSGHPFSIMLRVREKQTSPINVGDLGPWLSHSDSVPISS
jgi:hypothetical protein